MPLFLCPLPLLFPSLTRSGTLSGHGSQSEYAKPSFFLWGSSENSHYLVLAKSRSFLFSYPEKGAEAAGILMTVIRTAKLSQVDSEKYIAYVLTQLGKTGQEDIDRLLPLSESLLKKVRSSKYEVPKSVVDSIKKDKYE